MSKDALTASEREFVTYLGEWYEEAQLDREQTFTISAVMVCRLNEAFERIAPAPKPISLAQELYEAEGLYADKPYAERSAGERLVYERMAAAMHARGAK